ncbi:hypothetical protein WDU94_008437 [Cyamophila willieti]
MDIMDGGTVELHITNSKNKDESCLNLKKLKLNNTIGELKQKLELLTGQVASNMSLSLYNRNHELVAHLSDNSTLLGQYPVENEMTLYVEGNFLTDTLEASDTQFVLPEEKYKEHKENLRSFMAKAKEERLKREALLKEKNDETEKVLEEDLLKGVEVGKRCKITDSDVRYGTVMFVGETKFSPGVWVGVKLDEPLGKNNGAVKGVQYFECEENYGMMVKPGRITIGDFPVLDPFDDLDEI